jgi:hypothetical protein
MSPTGINEATFCDDAWLSAKRRQYAPRAAVVGPRMCYRHSRKAMCGGKDETVAVSHLDHEAAAAILADGDHRPARGASGVVLDRARHTLSQARRQPPVNLRRKCIRRSAPRATLKPCYLGHEVLAKWKIGAKEIEQQTSNLGVGGSNPSERARDIPDN